ncbi:phage tail protein I [Ralstonia pseudosolanacearum]|uniref:phage tail protein I n=1 Tax=Ralstonia pseudosolanacearum TaxID=1310165 RepID=UPI0026773685|nr:phage tail protein I [Ralstonia pseudosolanacearum]MDO3529467.1 phage tail protein I [Ralstonia pseudosolanacearum]
MSSATLLPPNATPLERRAAQTGARIERVPVPLRDLWNPATCPADLLPFLAWSFSVDRWNPAWPLATKRAVTAAAYFVHRRKGTIGALRRAVEPLGYLIRVIEWWQTNPPGPRGSFRLDVGVLQTGIDEAMYAELERLIDDAKPCSRPMLGLQISLEVRGTQATGAAAYLGDVLTVYPYEPPDIVVSGTAAVSAASHAIDTLTVTQ